MPRYIDAEKLKFDIFICTENFTLTPKYSEDYKKGWNDSVDAMEKQINEAPTIDTDRPHGEWISRIYATVEYYQCSSCDICLRKENLKPIPMHFCPNCGSDMWKEGDK